MHTPMPLESILIAEDDPGCAEDLQYRLKHLDYRVTGLTSKGLGALAIAQRHKPDLVLMDIQLRGGLDGIQTAERMHELQLPVVFVTGHCEGPVFERAKCADPSGYVVKPYQTAELKASIELALHRHKTDQQRQKELRELKHAVAEAKTLNGLLSICGYCKKIREPEGTWKQIEVYLMQHTKASFTHGMCPHCFEAVKRKLEAVERGESGPALVIG